MITIRLKQPLVHYSRGEQFTYEPDWCEWRRKATGEVFNYRGSIAQGEIAMLLTYLYDNKLTSLVEIIE